MGRLSALACAALFAIAASLFALAKATNGLDVSTQFVGAIPTTVYKKPGEQRRPVILLAHGFAGSQQFMQPLAVTLARNGFIAVTFDFAGHGRNAEPLHGGLADLARSTHALLDQLDQMFAFATALPQADGGLGAVGHSMAADLVVRYAAAHPQIGAVVALSLFGTEATPEKPKNLLVIDGAWESDRLKRAGYRVVAAAAGGAGREGVTYGDLAQGSARRFALAPSVEHIGVLYSAAALQETLSWMNGAFGKDEVRLHRSARSLASSVVPGPCCAGAARVHAAARPRAGAAGRRTRLAQTLAALRRPGAAHASSHMDAADALSPHADCRLSGDAFRGLCFLDLRRSFMA